MYIGANNEKLYVFNKIDLLREDIKIALIKKFENIHPIFLSSHSGDGIDNLIDRLASLLFED